MMLGGKYPANLSSISGWALYVEAAKTLGGMNGRMDEVPQEMRSQVKSHVKMVLAMIERKKKRP